jgi:cyclopropane fatty-acyl-phospholipid synthase-like methyltransferase
VPYPPQVAEALVDALDLDGTGRLLDVGCGPGSLTLLLAPHVAEAIGVDPDADMLTEAARLARERQLIALVRTTSLYRYSERLEGVTAWHE